MKSKGWNQAHAHKYFVHGYAPLHVASASNRSWCRRSSRPPPLRDSLDPWKFLRTGLALKADWSTLNSGCCQDGVWWIASGCKTTKATSHQPILYSWAASKYRVYLYIWSRPASGKPPPAPPATIPHKGDQPSRGHGEFLWWIPAKEGSGNVGAR